MAKVREGGSRGGWLKRSRFQWISILVLKIFLRFCTTFLLASSVGQSAHSSYLLRVLGKLSLFINDTSGEGEKVWL